ncbi:EamA family transporter [Streptomyces sp. A7024]|uniref:EamA family transporter n=1 Tax=Streptomyces coryli TaxID=1128680 RepID=A0A6G4U3T5_9ACTN|nr:EamA family transporter [Streptomyces coryli]NGN66028.1 EamA family transporter [Streptomyces coryli]
MSREIPAPGLVLGAVVSVQCGQALGKGLFDTVGGPLGAVTLRLLLAALMLLALWRPRRLPAAPQDRRLILAFGTAIAGMNLIYPALERMPLGVAIGIQLTGPLAVSLLTSRRAADVLWGLLAAAGIACFLLPGSGGEPLPLTGLAFAVASAVSMGSYLLLSRRTGHRLPGGGPLALAVLWAGLLSLPFGLAQSGTRLVQPHALAAGLVVALLSAALPYSLELMALRRLPARVVGVLQSLEPVAAGLAGLAILGERLSVLQWCAVALIATASGGAVAGAGRKRREKNPLPARPASAALLPSESSRPRS